MNSVKGTLIWTQFADYTFHTHTRYPTYPSQTIDCKFRILKIWRLMRQHEPFQFCVFTIKKSLFYWEKVWVFFKDGRFYLESYHKNLSIYIFYLFPVTSKAEMEAVYFVFLLRSFLLHRSSFTHFRRTLSQSEISSVVCSINNLLCR